MLHDELISTFRTLGYEISLLSTDGDDDRLWIQIISCDFDLVYTNPCQIWSPREWLEKFKEEAFRVAFELADRHTSSNHFEALSEINYSEWREADTTIQTNPSQNWDRILKLLNNSCRWVNAISSVDMEATYEDGLSMNVKFKPKQLQILAKQRLNFLLFSSVTIINRVANDVSSVDWRSFPKEVLPIVRQYVIG